MLSVAISFNLNLTEFVEIMRVLLVYQSFLNVFGIKRLHHAENIPIELKSVVFLCGFSSFLVSAATSLLFYAKTIRHKTESFYAFLTLSSNIFTLTELISNADKIFILISNLEKLIVQRRLRFDQLFKRN